MRKLRFGEKVKLEDLGPVIGVTRALAPRSLSCPFPLFAAPASPRLLRHGHGGRFASRGLARACSLA